MCANDPKRAAGAETFEVQQLGATMEQSRWNEGRLDDLNEKVDAGIGRLDDERKELRAEMRAGFERVDGEFKELRAEMKAGFETLNDRFTHTLWALLGGAATIIGALVAAVIAQPHL
jgi:hypothetical protein